MHEKNPRRTPLLAVVTLAVLAMAGDAGAADRHLIVVHGANLPAGLAAEVAALGGTIDRSIPQVGLALVSGLDDVAVAELAARPQILAVEKERTLRIDVPPLSFDGLDLAETDPEAQGPEQALAFPIQWHLRAIDADVAWAAGETGSPDVAVAVLDTGLDYTSPELVGRVDLGRSISLLPDQDALVEQLFPGAHPITDLHFHGTFVGSLIASNAVVTAGVTSETTLFGVKVCDVTGDCREGEVLAGMVYAADAGADVLNMSIGGFGGLLPLHENPGLVAVVNRVFNYVHQRGAVVVVAAGNSALDLDHLADGYEFWCDSPHTICVSATAPTSGGLTGPWPDPDTFTFYSNFGQSAITVAAPGGIGPPGGLVFAACSTTTILPFVQQICGALGFFGSAGTSFAAPHVSGLAALLVERFPGNPNAIAAAIRNSAADLGDPGHDALYGHGRIDVAAALDVD